MLATPPTHKPDAARRGENAGAAQVSATPDVFVERAGDQLVLSNITNGLMSPKSTSPSGCADRLVAIPGTADMQPVLVEPAAAVAVDNVVGIEILNG